MTRVIVAPDSFKESLSSPEAADAIARGVRFLDASGRPLPAGVPALLNLAGIDMSGLHPAIAEAEVIAACDVSNPLCGPSGAAICLFPRL